MFWANLEHMENVEKDGKWKNEWWKKREKKMGIKKKSENQ